MQVQLKKPVTVEGKLYSEVVVHPIRGKDMRVLSQIGAEIADAKERGVVGPTEIEMLLRGIGSRTDLPMSVVDQFEQEDIESIADAFNSFFPKPTADGVP
jgi:hypothetical protein